MLRHRDDYRTEASRRASATVVALCETGTVLGLGAGPDRVHFRAINLNIAKVSNVDVVADAHCLPIASGSVDGVHCEAVFEHLEDPAAAAAEMYRVMKPGGIAYVCTPFMQPFHAYPSHYQNFTHIGHRRLFERCGFNVIECGVCVGPAWALASIIAAFIAHYTPRPLRWPARAVWFVIGNMLRPLDKWLSSRPDAYLIASTTYVLVAK